MAKTRPTFICRCVRFRCRSRRPPSSSCRRSCQSRRGLFAYTSIPTFRNAHEVLFVERRGVDVLDAIVVIGCLGTLQIFPGPCLVLVPGIRSGSRKKTQDDSKRLC